jgi:hypothetical protein
MRARGVRAHGAVENVIALDAKEVPSKKSKLIEESPTTVREAVSWAPRGLEAPGCGTLILVKRREQEGW